MEWWIEQGPRDTKERSLVSLTKIEWMTHTLTQNIHQDESHKEALIRTLSNTWTQWSNLTRPYTCPMKNDTMNNALSSFFIYLFIFAHTLINNEWTPMKIHTQMIKPSPHMNVTWILTNKTTSQNNISEPLPMGWMIGKNVTILHAVTCEKPPLKVEQR